MNFFGSPSDLVTTATPAALSFADRLLEISATWPRSEREANRRGLSLNPNCTAS